MDENRSPTLDEFKSRVREHFEFLTADFGMEEVAPLLRNEFSVAYANSTTRVEVEGINWGFGVQTYVGYEGLNSPVDPAGPGTPLWALVKYKAPNEFDELTRTSRQIELVDIHARLLRRHLSEVLSGRDGAVIEAVNSRFKPGRGFDI